MEPPEELETRVKRRVAERLGVGLVRDFADDLQRWAERHAVDVGLPMRETMHQLQEHNRAKLAKLNSMGYG